MFSRSLAILLAPSLPTAALILSFGQAHTVNALVVGTLAVGLSGFSLISRRIGMLVCLLAAWVALTAFIFPSTFLEQVIVVSWGVAMFTCMFGPFSERPRVTTTAAVLAKPPASVPVDSRLPLAA